MDDERPSHIYYQADVQNSQVGDTLQFNPLAFSEVRQGGILGSGHDYEFTIVRFELNGAGRLLPNFIPQIQAGQSNPNLTVYGIAISYSQTWTVGSTTYTFNTTPPYTYVLYTPENTNPVQAPTPRAPVSSLLLGTYSASVGYQPGQVVGTAGSYSNTVAPFYQCVAPTQTWNSSSSYSVGAYVSYGSAVYTLTGTSTIALPPPEDTGNWTVGAYGLGTSSAAFTSITLSPTAQDVSSSYYYVSNYTHAVELINAGIISAHQATFTLFGQQWYSVYGSSSAFPFANYASFAAYCNPPQLLFNSDTQKFYFTADSDGFGNRIKTFTSGVVGTSAVAVTAPVEQLFINTDLYGLLSNFNVAYTNTPNANGQTYAYQILFNALPFNSNILDLTQYPGGTSGGSNNGYVPSGQWKYWWICEQDFSSVDFWSPISAIVFTTSQIPVSAELESAAQQLGTQTLASSGAAFSNIITDISLDLSPGNGSSAYRQFIFYAPTAEYRMIDLSGGVKDIDLRVYWKSRWGALYPIQMYNNASASVKMLFRKKNVGGKRD